MAGPRAIPAMSKPIACSQGIEAALSGGEEGWTIPSCKIWSYSYSRHLIWTVIAKLSWTPPICRHRSLDSHAVRFEQATRYRKTYGEMVSKACLICGRRTSIYCMK